MLNWIIWNGTVFWHWNCTYNKHNALDKRGKYLTSQLFWRENHSKLCKQNFAGSLTLIYIPRKCKFIVGYTNFKLQGQ